MRKKSQGSAGAIYLDREERVQELRQAARRARERITTILRVILFGSLVDGAPTPRSDADLLVIVSSSPHEHHRDRMPEILRAFSPLPCPMDVFALTQDEFERHREEGSPLVRAALTSGMDLLS
jgi:predicted nucleotidyltransferase